MLDKLLDKYPAPRAETTFPLVQDEAGQSNLMLHEQTGVTSLKDARDAMQAMGSQSVAIRMRWLNK